MCTAGKQIALAATACALLIAACSKQPAEPSEPVKENPQPTLRLRMATTTSTENSGLLYELLPPFEKQNDCKVDVIAVGTGKALKLGQNGDVDVVFVHARDAEDEFVADGFGVSRRDVMYNDFVILGPESDPAGIKGTKDAAVALKSIAKKQTCFCSRGDDSGTHKKEKALWQAAGVEPEGQWYVETGQGMGATLTVANEKLAYALADRGTYLAFRDKIQVTVLCEGDERLFNPYGIIAVDPKRHAHAKHDLAMKLIAYVTSPQGQQIIASFKKSGEQLFHPNAAGDE